MTSRTVLGVLIGYAVVVSISLIVVAIVCSLKSSGPTTTADDTTPNLMMYDSTEDMMNTTEKPIMEKIQVDMKKNRILVHMSGEDITPGTMAVIDQSMSLMAIYDPEVKRCYLMSGIPKEMENAMQMNDNFEKKRTTGNVMTKYYKETDDYAVTDISMVPSPLKSSCKNMEVRWLEPGTSMDGTNRPKRRIGACGQVCVRVWRFRRCYRRCV